MESVKLRTITGKAKVVGVILCVAGAATLAFYKGPHLKPLIHYHLFSHHNNQVDLALAHPAKTWTIGCFLMLTACALWALWLILQGLLLTSYPSKLLFTTIQCFLSTIQSFMVAISFERSPSQWKLGWDVRLLSVAYCGMVVTGITFYLQAWCIEKKGPVFAAMSNPLSLIITIFFSTFLLGEIISLGSILGAILLVGGLYSVLWAKSEEQVLVDGNKQEATSDVVPDHHLRSIWTSGTPHHHSSNSHGGAMSSQLIDPCSKIGQKPVGVEMGHDAVSPSPHPT